MVAVRIHIRRPELFLHLAGSGRPNAGGFCQRLLLVEMLEGLRVCEEAQHILHILNILLLLLLLVLLLLLLMVGVEDRVVLVGVLRLLHHKLMTEKRLLPTVLSVRLKKRLHQALGRL